jgi:predicted MPP superfamily phosphohydrolase
MLLKPLAVFVLGGNHEYKFYSKEAILVSGLGCLMKLFSFIKIPIALHNQSDAGS